MKTRVLFVLLFASLVARAQSIQVSGDQAGVWEADTVLVTGDVMVADSLVVRPGTLVLFDGFYSISVLKNAFFEAQGTASDSIVFTVADTTGFSQYMVESGGWNGFQLDKARHFMLDYCVLEYGKAFSGNDWAGGVLSVIACDDVSILHSTLRHSAAHERGGAISAQDSRIRMQACAVNYNTVFNAENMYIYGGGACFLKCDVDLYEMEFKGNNAPTIGGALSIDSCSVVLDRAVFVDNLGVNGGGLYLMRSNERSCRMSNLLFDDNYSRHFAGGFAIADASPDIDNVLVINNSSEGVSCNGVFFYGDSNPRLTNCIIYGNYAPEASQHVDTAQMWVWTNTGFAPEFRNCLVEGGLRYIHSAENIQVFEDIIDADPLFVDAENHNFHLTPNSPCVDAGNPTVPQYLLDGFDLDGNTRVFNQRIDIGPYEYSAAAVPSSISTGRGAWLVGNPLGAQSRIEFDEVVTGDLTVSVYAMSGTCVAQKTFNSDGSRSLEIGAMVERLPSGVYLIEVRSAQKSFVLKAVR